MNRIVRIVAALVVGVVGFLAVGLAVSVVLDPYVWPSLFVGLPVGFASGVAAAVLSYAGLTYLSERDSEGTISPATAERLWAAIAAVGGFLLASIVTVVAATVLALPVATTMLTIWLPLSLVGAAVAAFVGMRAARQRRERRPSV
jgi:hypothetical protein